MLRRWARREKDTEAAAAALEQLESYRRAFRDQSFFLALESSRTYYVYDGAPDQRRVRAVPLRPDSPADRWYFEALRRGSPYGLNVDVNATLGAVKVWINVLLRDADGTALGVGGSGIDVSDFLAEAASSAASGAPTILVDRRGVLQAHWNRAYVERNARALEDAGKLTIQDLLPSPDDRERLAAMLARLAAEEEDVGTLTLGMEGRTWLVAAAFMKGMDWHDLVLLDASSILSTRQFMPLLAAIAAGIALLLAVLTWTLDRWILRPLASLTAASRAVAEGDYGVTVPVAREDEGGLLARTFNKVTSTILDYTLRVQERVEDRTRQLSEANSALRASRHRIDESIRYAREIQASILPSEEALRADLGEPLVLFLPRDVVGGDFYLHRRVAGGYLAGVVDCTGHGVPGAFVSMAASAALDALIEAHPAAEPGEMLGHLDRQLRQAKRRREERGALDAGLDVALCRANRAERRLLFAGAGLSLHLVQAGEVTEVRGDRARVGYRGAAPAGIYRTRAFSPPDGVRAYLVTDGILDQAGGERGFGLGSERLAALLRSLAGVPMGEQRTRLARSSP